MISLPPQGLLLTPSPSSVPWLSPSISTPRGLLVWGPSGLLSRLLETSTRGRQLHEGSPDAPSRCRPWHPQSRLPSAPPRGLCLQGPQVAHRAWTPGEVPAASAFWAPAWLSLCCAASSSLQGVGSGLFLCAQVHGRGRPPTLGLGGTEGYGAGEDSWESLGLQGDPISQS